MDTYFTTKELSEYLHIAEQSIRRWVMAGKIPFHRIHGSVRYRLTEIEKWVESDGNFTLPLSSEPNELGLFDETADVEITGDDEAVGGIND
jgi:excisionase family DNA binding protein